MTATVATAVAAAASFAAVWLACFFWWIGVDGTLPRDRTHCAVVYVGWYALAFAAGFAADAWWFW